MILATLYKKNKEKIQVWQIEVDNSKYRSIEGFQDGVKTTSEWSIAKGKNIGKANEVYSDQQAIIEAEAKVKLKINKGYVKNIADINNEKRFEPMLAEKWKDFKHKIVYPCYAQPKLDGMRCNTIRDGSFSREGKPVNSVPHITGLFTKLDQGIVVDGELYNHELHDDFNQIISIAKKLKPSTEDLKLSKEKLKYYIYDAYFAESPDMIFSQRFFKLLSMFNSLEHVVIVPTIGIHDEQELEKFYDACLSQGYEGMMIRNDVPYFQKRTTNLLKRKEWLDDEFEIVDITEGKGNRSGMMGRIVLKTKSGEQFEADGSGLGGHEAYKKMLVEKNNYIGKMATVRYQNLTPDRQVPRFPKVVAIRDYE